MAEQQGTVVKKDGKVTYVLVKVSHNIERSNSINKDSYVDISSTIFVHPNREKVIVKLNEILKEFPKDKYTIITPNVNSHQVFDSEKKLGWISNSRSFDLLYTYTITEYLQEQ